MASEATLGSDEHQKVLMVTNIPVKEGDATPSAPSPTSSSADLASNGDPVEAEVFVDYELLVEAPLRKGCEDDPATTGSHGLPLLDLSSTTSFTDSPDSPPPILGQPLLPTPPISPISITIDSDEESPCADINTPLKFDSSELTWRKSKDVPGSRRMSSCLMPTSIDYLQVPPRHRSAFKKKLSFSKRSSDPGMYPPRLPERPQLEDIVSTSPEPTCEPLEDEITPELTQVNGANQAMAAPVMEVETVHNFSAANCIIKIPKKQRKPSFSKIDIPCYHRRPSGQALDDNFDYTFTVVSHAASELSLALPK